MQIVSLDSNRESCALSLEQSISEAEESVDDITICPDRFHDHPPSSACPAENHETTVVEYYPLPFQQGKLVKFIFLLLGIGFLLPWNAFVSASAYFETRTLAETSGKEKNNFMSWFSLLNNLSGVVTLAFMLIWQKRHIILPNWNLTRSSPTPLTRQNLEWRFIVVSLSFFLFVMILTASMVLIPSLDPRLFQTISLCSSAICGASGAFTSAGIVSFAQIFPPNLGLQPFISGQAVGGVVISILNFVLFGLERTGADEFWAENCGTKGVYSFDVSTQSEYYVIDWGAFAYFTVGAIIISSCIVLFLYLDRAPITEYYRSNNYSQRTRAPLVTGNARDDENEIHHLAEPLTSGEEVDIQPMSQRCDITSDSMSFLKISASTIFFTFLITITIFPSWITRLESVHECEDRHDRLSNDLFVPGLIVLFNIFDLLGRVSAGYTNSNQLLKSGALVRMGALTRIMFLPLFLLLKAPNNRFPTIFSNDWLPPLFTASLAYTNGWISTLAFTFAALSVPSDDDIQQMSSTILNFAVGLGLLSGSLLSFVYTFVGSRVLPPESNPQFQYQIAEYE
jgi:equilibrative nucleoside transporter 1/2/3